MISDILDALCFLSGASLAIAAWVAFAAGSYIIGGLLASWALLILTPRSVVEELASAYDNRVTRKTDTTRKVK